MRGKRNNIDVREEVFRDVHIYEYAGVEFGEGVLRIHFEIIF